MVTFVTSSGVGTRRLTIANVSILIGGALREVAQDEQGSTHFINFGLHMHVLSAGLRGRARSLIGVDLGMSSELRGRRTVFKLGSDVRISSGLRGRSTVCEWRISSRLRGRRTVSDWGISSGFRGRMTVSDWGEAQAWGESSGHGVEGAKDGW